MTVKGRKRNRIPFCHVEYLPWIGRSGERRGSFIHRIRGIEAAECKRTMNKLSDEAHIYSSEINIMSCVKSGRVALAIEPQSSSLLRTDQFTASGRQKKVPAVPGLTSSLFPSNSFDRYFLSATPRPFLSRLSLELAISRVHISTLFLQSSIHLSLFVQQHVAPSPRSRYVPQATWHLYRPSV